MYMVSAHAFDHLRQTKEFGLRVIFSLPLGGGTGTGPTPPPAASVSANASVAGPSSADGSGSGGFDAVSGVGEGGGRGGGSSGRAAGVVQSAVLLPSPLGGTRQRWGALLRRVLCWRGGERFFGCGRWRRPAARCVWVWGGGRGGAPLTGMVRYLRTYVTCCEEKGDIITDNNTRTHTAVQKVACNSRSAPHKAGGGDLAAENNQSSLFSSTGHRIMCMI